MSLENMKVSELLSLLKVINPQVSTQISGSEIRIVILQRGWVIVGKYYQNGSECWIENGYIVRIWGTDKGLGQLALEGKQSNTKLDKIPLTKFHELTVVASIICDKNKWEDLCK